MDFDRYLNEPDKLVSEYQLLSLQERTDNPDLAYSAGKRLAALGQHVHAQEAYTAALAGYNLTGDRTGACRVVVGRAYQAYYAGDYDECANLCNYVLDIAEQDPHLMAAHSLLGSVFREKGDTQSSIDSLILAIRYGSRAWLDETQPESKRRLSQADIVPIAQKLSDAYASIGAHQLAAFHQKQALDMAMLVEGFAPHYSAWVYLKQVEWHELAGDLDSALAICRRARSMFPLGECQEAAAAESRILLKMGREFDFVTMFSAPLSANKETQDKSVLSQARVALYQSNLVLADSLLQRVRGLEQAIPLLSIMSCLSKSPSTVSRELDYADRLVTSNRFLELSELLFIIAWQYAIRGDLAESEITLQRSLEVAKTLGHVTHLWRLYHMSLGDMSVVWYMLGPSFWDMKNDMDAMMKREPSGRIKLMLFGKPSILVDGQNQFQRNRPDSKLAPLLLALVDNPEVPSYQLVDMVWGGGGSMMSFHKIRQQHPFLKDLLVYENGDYSLGDIHYVDTLHFEQMVHSAVRESDAIRRLSLYKAALSISSRQVCSGLAHPYIQDKRDRYAIDRARIISDIMSTEKKARTSVFGPQIPSLWIIEKQRTEERFRIAL